MAETVRMPEILAGAAEGAIQTWLVAPGATVTVGQPLAEIETDKAIVELMAEAAGVVAQLLVGEGDSVSVGEPILVLGAEGETVDEVEHARAKDASAPTDADPADAPFAAAQGADGAARTEGEDRGGASAPSSRLFVSPLVRRLTAEAGVDLQDLEGSGPQGRIVRRDFERHIADQRRSDEHAHGAEKISRDLATVAGPSAVAPFVDEPLSRMRSAIARHLTESKTTVPHFYLVADCRVDDLLALREKINVGASRRISVNDFVVKAVAAAMREVPDANAIWNTESIRHPSSVEISVAVATEGGLMTPVVRGVDAMSLSELSATVAELATRAREGQLKQSELEGGSFAVSNLGMYGTDQFSAILNPPQSGILAVGAARAQPVVDDDGRLAVGHVMSVTLSADHRVLDGAVAAKWLAAFRRFLENPLTILV
ncbi:dihydrolipoamide acetyltransferase family protein [Microbacterium sp. NPDC076911]|uniref:dihydrolipoamide acetyltransferase family protein n=1 Tax=Microbacterium sp. NPDC076911 TaxID=3154958 RepID=UPI003416146B